MSCVGAVTILEIREVGGRCQRTCLKCRGDACLKLLVCARMQSRHRGAFWGGFFRRVFLTSGSVLKQLISLSENK